jgi:hypothetical protein
LTRSWNFHSLFGWDSPRHPSFRWLHDIKFYFHLQSTLVAWMDSKNSPDFVFNYHTEAFPHLHTSSPLILL